MNWHKYFDYDLLTGSLRYKKLCVDDFASEAICNRRNSRFAGKIAGAKSYQSNGGSPAHIKIRILGIRTTAHAVVWEIHYGQITPGMMIDHIDGNPFNNRINNLRLVSAKENAANCVASRNNLSRLKGVHLADRAWVAQIRSGGSKIYLGSFLTKGMAALAYAKASIRIHGEHSVFVRKKLSLQ